MFSKIACIAVAATAADALKFNKPGMKTWAVEQKRRNFWQAVSEQLAKVQAVEKFEFALADAVSITATSIADVDRDSPGGVVMPDRDARDTTQVKSGVAKGTTLVLNKQVDASAITPIPPVEAAKKPEQLKIGGRRYKQ